MDFSLTKEQEFFRRSLREFCVKELQPIADKVEQEGNIPKDFLSKLAGARLFGIPCDKKYGGAGQGLLEVVLAVEELSRVSSAVGMTIATHYLPMVAITLSGNEEQGNRFLPGLAREGVGSLAFTEPSTGSDPGAITTTARLEGDHYVINGTKRFISNAPYSGSIVILAKDGDGISAFIGEKNTEGYSAKAVWELMGLNGLKVADIDLKDWCVPVSNLLGKPGGGYTILLNAISVGKLNICAMLLGTSEAALDEALKYAKERTVRDKPIAAFQGIQWLIADMATKIEAIRSMTYRLASMVDQGANILKESAMTKLFVSEAAVEITTKAMEVQGCYSYTKDLKTERLHRNAMVGCTIEGSNEIQRVIIANSMLR